MIKRFAKTIPDGAVTVSKISKLGNIFAVGMRPAEDKTIYVNPVDGGADATFADASAHVAITNDTDNVQCFLTNQRSLKFTTDGVDTFCYGQENFAVAKDLSTAYGMFVRFYIHEGAAGATDYAKLSQLYMLVCTDGANYDRYNLYYSRAIDPHPGWYEIVVPRSMIVGAGAGTLNWATVGQLRFGITPSEAAATVAVTFDEVRFLPKMSTARVYLCLDDGHASAYEAAQRMNYYGIKGTFFINPSIVGDAGRVKWTQLAEMRDMEHLISNHTNGTATWSAMAEADKVATVIAAQEALASHGHYAGQRIFATPGGGIYWPDDNGAIVGPLVDVMRPLQGDALMRVSTYRPYGSNRRVPHTAEYGNLTDDATRDLHKTAVTNAISDGCCAVLCLHNLADAAQKTRFDNILQHIKTSVDAGTLEAGVLSQVQTIT